MYMYSAMIISPSITYIHNVEKNKTAFVSKVF
jgi:hypothetical protein